MGMRVGGRLYPEAIGLDMLASIRRSLRQFGHCSHDFTTLVSWISGGFHAPGRAPDHSRGALSFEHARWNTPA